MTYKIPTDGKFAQPNRGEISGNLYRTQSVDLKTNPGKLRVAPRVVVSTKDNDGGITNMGVPIAIVSHNGGSGSRYYAACGVGDSTGTGAMLVTGSDSPSVAFANDVVTGTPKSISLNRSDMVIWNTAETALGLQPSIIVSTFASGIGNATKLQFNSDHWVTNWFSTTGLSFSIISALNFCPAFNGNLYVITNDHISFVAPSADGTATPIATNSGTGTINFKNAFYPLWGRSTSSDLWFSLVSGGGDKSVRGYMGQWDTTGTALNKIIDIDAPCALSGVVVKDVPYILDAYGRLKKLDSTGFGEVARLPVANQNIEMPGIYDSANNARWVHHRGMDVVDGKINILVNNFVSTGVYVEDMPSGIWEFDPDQPELGLYHKGAPCADTNDWGQQLLNTVGAIFGTKRSTASFLMGASYYTDSGSTSRNAVFYDDIVNTTSRRAIVTLPWFYATGITDVFQKAFYRFRQLVSGSKIIGKYRVSKSATLPFVASITWTSTTTFTSTDSNFQYASVGDEIEVVMGKGASTTAHILTIPAAVGGTYTVTLEDAIGYSSGSAKVKVNNFRKMGVISKQNTGSDMLSILKTEGTVQIKTEFRDEGNMELNDLTITSVPHQQ